MMQKLWQWIFIGLFLMAVVGAGIWLATRPDERAAPVQIDVSQDQLAEPALQTSATMRWRFGEKAISLPSSGRVRFQGESKTHEILSVRTLEDGYTAQVFPLGGNRYTTEYLPLRGKKNVELLVILKDKKTGQQQEVQVTAMRDSGGRLPASSK